MTAAKRHDAEAKIKIAKRKFANGPPKTIKDL